jgi:hypothetical protein
MRAPTPRIPRQDFINSVMSMAAACDSAADLPKVIGRRSRLHRCDDRKVLSCARRINLWQLFRCRRNPAAAIPMALMTTLIKASMAPPRLPPSVSLDRDRAITAPKRSGSDLVEIS